MTFDEILTQMSDTYKRKNHDYGNSFDKTLDSFGTVAGVVRLNDKINRINSLITKQNQQVNDESIDDTLLDLANYAVMTLLWRYNSHDNQR